MKEIEIRESRAEDLCQIEQLYPQAFPEEDLLPVVRELLDNRPDVLSLVACDASALIGHIAFSDCGIQDADIRASLLAPLAVSPDHQRQGVGSALVRNGMERLSDTGMTSVYVLGDPNYYGRFGFTAEHDVEPPYPLPAEWEGAWQSLSLSETEKPQAGKLVVSGPWQDPALWLP